MNNGIDILEMFLFPHYKMIVFNSRSEHTEYSLSHGMVCYNRNSCENDFLNRKDVKTNNHRMLGRLSLLDDEKCKTIFIDARKPGPNYPLYQNPWVTDSPLESLKSYLKAEGWEHHENKTWIIIPRSAKKLSGNHMDVQFNVIPEDFGEKRLKTLPVYFNKITPQTKEVTYHLEIPDYLYDFLSNHPVEEQRPTSKVISTNTFSGLQNALTNLCTTADALHQFDKLMERAKESKYIAVCFAGTQKKIRDSYHFGYTGKSTNIYFHFFIAYKLATGLLTSQTDLYVDKRYEQGKGFVPVTGRLIPVHPNRDFKLIKWTKEREDFLMLLENRFNKLTNDLNNFLGDIDENKIDLMLRDDKERKNLILEW